jgi:hypothetical protein
VAFPALVGRSWGTCSAGPANLVANLNVIAAYDIGHNRHYDITVESLTKYIQLNNIIKRPVEDKKVEVVKKDDRIMSRYDIMEID